MATPTNPRAANVIDPLHPLADPRARRIRWLAASRNATIRRGLHTFGKGAA